MFSAIIIMNENSSDFKPCSINWDKNGFHLIKAISINDENVQNYIKDFRPELILFCLDDSIQACLPIIEYTKCINPSSEYMILSSSCDFFTCRNFYRLGGYEFIHLPSEEDKIEEAIERLFLKLYNQNPQFDENNPACSSNIAFSKLVDYVTLNFSEKHNLKSLSQSFHLSEGYICKLFSREYSTTLTAFLTKLRMEEAASLISSSTRAMKEVSLLCGYTDYFYFCRVFKSYHGMSPTEYRAKTQNE